MNVSFDAVRSRVSKHSIPFALTFALVFAAAPASLFAQEPAPEAKPADSRPSEVHRYDTRKTFFLANNASLSDLQDIQTCLRNMINRAKIYGVASQNAISVEGTAEDIQNAQEIITELDRPKKIYRLTYTLTDFDGGKRTGSQQFSLVVMQNDRSDLKQGTKVPIVTGSISHDSGAADSQFQYLDVGVHIEANVVGSRLGTKIELSSVADEKSSVGQQDPILRQSVFNGLSLLPMGKAVVLGSIDVPGTTRRQEIQVTAEAEQ